MLYRFLTPEDLAEFVEDASTAKLEAVLSDVYAEMLTIAPSIDTKVLSPAQEGLATAILRTASIRYISTDAGTLSSRTDMSGSFSQTAGFRQEDILSARQIRQLEELELALSETPTTTQKGLQEVSLLPTRWGQDPEMLWRPLWRSY